MNPALISEIIPAFWAFMNGNAGTHPLCHHRLCGYAGTSLFMNYFYEVVELSDLKKKKKKQIKTQKQQQQTKWIETLRIKLMLEGQNLQRCLVWDSLG